MKQIILTLSILMLALLPANLTGCDKVKGFVDGLRGAEPKKAEPKKADEKPKADINAEPKRIAMVLAHEGYQDKEYEIPRKLFEEAGFEVLVVSLFMADATGALDGKAKVDLTLDEAVKKVAEYDAVVFVGGPGSTIYHNDKIAHKFAQEAADAGKVVAAICLAPYTLANAGVLAGVKATAWVGGKFAKETLMKGGAFFRDEDVVVEERIVTGNGPGAAKAFGKAIVQLLQ